MRVNRREFMHLTGTGALGLALWTASCAVDPVSGRRQLMLISEDQELQLGRQTDRQVVQEYGIYDDRALTDYVNDLCQRMGKLSHRPNLQYHFKILDAAVVNAFAAPGGYIYFTRGILAYLNSEAELAGVMGHEMGHITARHSAEQLSKAQLAQVGLGLGMVVSDAFRAFGELAQVGAQMLFLKFSRDNEREADDLGVEYAAKSGYDARQLAEFFETLEGMRSSSDRIGLHSWFSTHPNPEDRQGAVVRKSLEWQQTLGLKQPKINRDTYLKRIDGLVYGEDPKEGYIEGGIFYHPGLRFQFPVPSNWKVNNTPKVVQMASAQKDAVILFSISSARSPKEGAQIFVRKNQASVIQSGGTTVNGLSAYQLLSQVKTRDGVLGVRSYFIQKDKRIFVFHGFAAANRFDQYRATFENTMERFRNLTDPKRLNVEPARLRIRSVRSRGTLGQGLKALGVPEGKLTEVALLNGKRLDEPVPAKTLLKVISK
jgi:predicted Zn-dependent protease